MSDKITGTTITLLNVCNEGRNKKNGAILESLKLITHQQVSKHLTLSLFGEFPGTS